MPNPATEPTDVELSDSTRTFVVRWADGAATRLPYRLLRQACSCAVCVDEHTGEPLLDPASVPADLGVTECTEMGLYGLRIHFSDGHGTGIYTFERLRALGAGA